MRYLNEDGDSDFVRIPIVLIMVFILLCLRLITWMDNRKMINSSFGVFHFVQCDGYV